MKPAALGIAACSLTAACPTAIYVRPAQAVQIAAKLDKKTYRPSQKARLNFSLTDEAGKPQPGALSLTAVDEAVMNVLGSSGRVGRAFSQLEQELLQPVYDIY